MLVSCEWCRDIVSVFLFIVLNQSPAQVEWFPGFWFFALLAVVTYLVSYVKSPIFLLLV